MGDAEAVTGRRVGLGARDGEDGTVGVEGVWVGALLEVPELDGPIGAARDKSRMGQSLGRTTGGVGGGSSLTSSHRTAPRPGPLHQPGGPRSSASRRRRPRQMYISRGYGNCFHCVHQAGGHARRHRSELGALTGTT